YPRCSSDTPAPVDRHASLSLRNLNDISPKSCDPALILTPLHLHFSGLIARTLTCALPGGRLPRLERVVIAVFPLKDVPVERLQHLIEKTVHRPAREISEIGAFPRHDVEHLRKLAVARDVRRIELEPIGSLARGAGRGSCALAGGVWASAVPSVIAPSSSPTLIIAMLINGCGVNRCAHAWCMLNLLPSGRCSPSELPWRLPGRAPSAGRQVLVAWAQVFRGVSLPGYRPAASRGSPEAAGNSRASPPPAPPRRGASPAPGPSAGAAPLSRDRKSTRLNSSHVAISYAVFCLKKKKIIKHMS